MKSQQAEYQRRKYRYVLSILYVFSRHHWLQSLTSKHPTKVGIELKKIYALHGTLENLQGDRGKEFYGAVKTFCERGKIKMTKSQAYHPEYQGKVERSLWTRGEKALILSGCGCFSERMLF